MFKTRLLTALVGIPLLLLVLNAGGLYWKILFIGIGLLGYYEITRMMANKEIKSLFIPGICFMLLFLFHQSPYFFLGLFFLLMVTVIYIILANPRYSITDLAFTFWGAFYIGFLLSYAIKIGNLEQSFLVILLALILTWASDTGAYIAGKLWGRHKMAPALSPNKTWEGTGGGLLLSAVASLAFFLITDMNTVNPAYALILGGIASILAQFGDLFISWMKRFFQVKDTGKILPGHGGILDRFDSFLLVVPLIYYFAVYVLLI